MNYIDLILDKLKDKVSSIGSNEVSLNKYVSNKTIDLIKRLSGKHIIHTKKVPDNVIVFSGASGGVGTSTLVSNIAYIATDIFKLKTLVVDLNILYPVQHVFKGIKNKPNKNDLMSYLYGETKLADSIDTENNILYAVNRGILDLINSESNAAEKNFERAVDVLRSLYDLVLIDTPMLLNNTLVNSAFYLSDFIYLVWDESVGSIVNTDKIRTNMVFTGIDTTKLRFVLNKKTKVPYSTYPFEKLNIKLVEIIPYNEALIDTGLKTMLFSRDYASKNEEDKKLYLKLISLTDKLLNEAGFIPDKEIKELKLLYDNGSIEDNQDDKIENNGGGDVDGSKEINGNTN
ncbi:MAG: AAA family ATPase [Candidatus Anstonellales archaeon]